MLVLGIMLVLGLSLWHWLELRFEMWCGLEARVRDEVRIEPVCGN